MDSGAAAVIQQLRRAHFRIWVALTVALFAVFVAGLIARRDSTPPNPNFHWEQLR